MYVRGQENLGGWQPRGDSLIFDHQWELEKLYRLEVVERIRHLLLTRASRDEDEEDSFYDLPASNHFQSGSGSGMKTSSSRLSLVAIANSPIDGKSSAPSQPEPEVPAMSMPRSLTFSSGIESLERSIIEEFHSDRDRDLADRCARLIQFHIPSQPPPIFPGANLLKPSAAGTNGSSSNLLTPGSGASTPDLASPEKSATFINGVGSWFEKEKAIFDISPSGASTNTATIGGSSSATGVARSSSAGSGPSGNFDLMPLFVPEIEEIRLSSIVSKKGYVNCLMASERCSTETTKWSKQWIVVRRPYLFIYKDEKDPVERSVINLANARVECSEQQKAMLCVENAFSVVTKHAGYLFRTNSAREMYDWLYSINPLYAGQLMCEWARAHHAATLESLKATTDDDGGSGSSASSPNTDTQVTNINPILASVNIPNLYQELCGSQQHLHQNQEKNEPNSSCSVLQ